MLNAVQDRHSVSAPDAGERIVAIFETALRQLQCSRGDPIATIDAALAEDPEFVSGHIPRAEVCISMWEPASSPKCR